VLSANDLTPSTGIAFTILQAEIVLHALLPSPTHPTPSHTLPSPAPTLHPYQGWMCGGLGG